MKNLKIKTILIIVFGMLFVITGVLSIYDAFNIRSVNESLVSTVKSYQLRHGYISAASENLYNIRISNFAAWYANESDEIRDAILQIQDSRTHHVESFRDNIHKFLALVEADPSYTEDDKQLRRNMVTDIFNLFDQYLLASNGLDQSVDEQNHDAMIQILLNTVPVGSELSASMNNLTDFVFKTTDQRIAAAVNHAGETVTKLTALTSIINVATVLAMLIFALYKIDKPIEKLTHAMLSITRGDMDRLPKTHQTDEIAILNNSISDMVDKLKQSAEQEAILQDTLSIEKTTSALKSSFLANMSHEIRTPLNAILGITEIQLNNDAMAAEYKEALLRIYNSGDLLLGILNDILDLSKIEAGKLELFPEKYEVASLINDTVMLNMMRIGNKPIEFKLKVNENIPTIFVGDTLRIKQILNNLLSNAFKYTETGTVTLFVDFQGVEKNIGNLICSVQDTGQGMSKEQLEQLFDEYTRFNAKANRTTEGAGLGMSITKNLINLMNGNIDIQSEQNIGSTFTIKIPQEIVSEKVLGKDLVASLESFQLEDAKMQRKTQIVYEKMPYGIILIVDDVESNLYVAQGLMAPYSINVTTADSGFEAIQKIKSGNVYDIVFMDHMMPEMDGIEATAAMRKLGYHEPIVALTANAVAGQADMFLHNGFDDFISKPIDTRQLNLILKKFVRDKQPAEVIAKYNNIKETKPLETAQNTQNDHFVPNELKEIFIRDANKALDYLNGIVVDKDNIKQYTTTVHAMKSALANVGEGIVSGKALTLEMAGRNEDLASANSGIQDFVEDLRAVVKKLTPTHEDDIPSTMAPDDINAAKDLFQSISTACADYDVSALEHAIAKLDNMQLDVKYHQMLSEIKASELTGDYDKIIELIQANI